MEKYFEIKKDNITIKCKSMYKNLNNINSVILSCHGFTGSKDNKTAALLGKILPEKYSNIMIISFDLPAHGNDESKPLSLANCNEYLETVIDYIKNKLKIDNIYAQGTSFGGYLLLKYINEHDNPFKMIALRCPAINIYNALTDRILTEDQIRLLKKGEDIELGNDKNIIINNNFVDDLKKNDINKKGLFNKYSNEIVVFHGNMDTLIDFEVVRNFCYMNHITFIPVIGADHGFNNDKSLMLFVKGLETFYNIDDISKEKNLKI